MGRMLVRQLILDGFGARVDFVPRGFLFFEFRDDEAPFGLLHEEQDGKARGEPEGEEAHQNAPREDDGIISKDNEGITHRSPANRRQNEQGTIRPLVSRETLSMPVTIKYGKIIKK